MENQTNPGYKPYEDKLQKLAYGAPSYNEKTGKIEIPVLVDKAILSSTKKSFILNQSYGKFVPVVGLEKVAIKAIICTENPNPPAPDTLTQTTLPVAVPASIQSAYSAELKGT